MSASIYETASPVRLPMQVKYFKNSDKDRWERFVFDCQDATFFHRCGWKEVMEKAFGHHTYYLYVEEDGELQGILPLVHIRTRLFGNGLISMPFCAYGGILATSEAAYESLERAARDLAEDLRVDYLELRNLKSRNSDWLTKELYVTFRKEIDPDPQKNILDIPRKQRAMVRKGIKSCLEAEVDQTTERFYDAYSKSVHNLGTPVFSRKYFKILKDMFGTDCEILTITRDERTVSSVMSFYFRDEVLPYYGGGTNESREVKANDFMYWELMRRCSEKGIKLFDFGRSKKGTGSYRFKKHWGFNPEPLYYEYFLVNGRSIPNVSPANPKYRFFIETWKHLPLGITKLVGPWIARNLG